MKALAKCLLFSRQAFKEIFFWCLLWQSSVISANLLLVKWVQDLTNCTLYNILSFSLLSKLSKSLNYLSLLIYKYKLFKFGIKIFINNILFYIFFHSFLQIPLKMCRYVCTYMSKCSNTFYFDHINKIVLIIIFECLLNAFFQLQS